MTKPLVSVIIPTYNCAKYLERAMSSVYDQNWPTRMIIVNDGSTDGTDWSAIRMKGRPPLTWIDQENQGPAAARNAGIAAATGEYIAFLDADDEWLPGRLERTVAPMIQNPSLAMVYCNARTRHIDDTESPRGKDCEKYRIRGAIYPPPRICTPAVTVRRAVLRHTGTFNEDLLFSEDLDLWIRIAEMFPVKEIKEPLVRVHERTDSMRHRSYTIQNKIDTRLILAKRTIKRNVTAQAEWWKPAFPTMAAAWLSAGIQCIQDGYRGKSPCLPGEVLLDASQPPRCTIYLACDDSKWYSSVDEACDTVAII